MPETPETRPVRAAIYARISSDKTGEGKGVDRQEGDCRALAKRLGWEVVSVYIDNDVSAASGKPRPEYRAMLDAVKAKEVDAILAWHPDRLHRRPAELEEFITLVQTYGTQIQTVEVTKESYDLSTEAGQLVARMLGAVARYEVDQTKKRIKAAADQRAREGKPRGGLRPFGYEKGGMVIRESEAAIIRECTEALLAGRTLASVARELRERGVTGTQGKPVTYNNLRDMLLKPRNAGIVAHGLPNRNAATNKSTREYEEIGPAAWPAIVPEDQWRALVKVLTDPGRRTYFGNQRESKHLGSSIYRCGIEGCGGKMRTAPNGGTPSKPGSRHTIYRCVESAHLTVRASFTDDYVRGVVAEMVRDPRIQAALAPNADPQLAVDREERAKLTRRLESFEDDYAAGHISAAQLKRATERVTAEIADIDTRSARLLRMSAAAAILRAEDPGQAFLDSPVDVQRAVLSTVLNVEVVPQERRGLAWSPARLRLSPAV
ncbi:MULTISPECIES: recombinase family protein [unclassified Microbacterium]|uniref:recombinase family protein n=1 Tax=unclassified Microbacterium TaxID=2609290 RepID=UPI003016BC21